MRAIAYDHFAKATARIVIFNIMNAGHNACLSHTQISHLLFNSMIHFIVVIVQNYSLAIFFSSHLKSRNKWLVRA